MIKIENVITPSPEQWKAIIMGTRNPMNSWGRSDSFCDPITDNCNDCPDRGKCAYVFEQDGKPYRSKIGPNDQDLMMRLAKGGPVHAKYRRMIAVYVTITAPLYWWKEFDTYKVGTVANSCSTMHKIAAKEFTLEDFSREHLYPSMLEGADDGYYDEIAEEFLASEDVLKIVINALNKYRNEYISASDDLKIAKDPKDIASLKAIQKKAWWQMIQLLPSSYNQKRTVMLNYEVLAGIYPSRKDHKLDEWKEFCKWIEGLPYSEIIVGERSDGTGKPEEKKDLKDIPICNEIMEEAKRRVLEEMKTNFYTTTTMQPITLEGIQKLMEQLPKMSNPASSSLDIARGMRAEVPGVMDGVTDIPKEVLEKIINSPTGYKIPIQYRCGLCDYNSLDDPTNEETCKRCDGYKYSRWAKKKKE